MQRFTPHEDDILRTLKRHRLSISQIEDGMFISQRPARRSLLRIIDGLIAYGYIVRTGQGRATKYELPYESSGDR